MPRFNKARKSWIQPGSVRLGKTTLFAAQCVGTSGRVMLEIAVSEYCSILFNFQNVRFSSPCEDLRENRQDAPIAKA